MFGFPLRGPSAVLSQHTPSSRELTVYYRYSSWVLRRVFLLFWFWIQSFPSPISWVKALLVPWEHRVGWFMSTRAFPYADGPTCCMSGGQTSSETSLTLPSCQGGNRFPGTTAGRCSVSLGRLCAVPARERLTNLLSFSRRCQTALLGQEVKTSVTRAFPSVPASFL